MVIRVIKGASVAGALLAGTFAFAVPAGAATRAVTSPAAVGPEVVRITYGPYQTLERCNVARDTVSQNFPPPLSESICSGITETKWVFVATYDV
jgi:hypothetical protein